MVRKWSLAIGQNRPTTKSIVAAGTASILAIQPTNRDRQYRMKKKKDTILLIDGASTYKI